MSGFCSTCGSELRPTDLHCSQCGSRTTLTSKSIVADVPQSRLLSELRGRECGFEIGFHDLDRFRISTQVTVLYEQPGSTVEPRHAELLAVAVFALRNWNNLGLKNASARESAALFGTVPFYLLGTLLTGTGVTIIDDQGPAQRRFVGKIHTRKGPVPLLHLDVKGFGMLGAGLGYFSPVALMALTEFLASRRAGDRAYQKQLKRTLFLAAGLFLSGKTKIAEEGLQATSIVAHSLWPERRSANESRDTPLPEWVTDTKDDLDNQWDSVGLFLADCCVVGRHCSVEENLLYRAFQIHCAENSEEAVPLTTFSEGVTQRGYLVQRNAGERIYEGLALSSGDPVQVWKDIGGCVDNLRALNQRR